MPAERTTAKPGCLPCRERHMRCDRGSPRCSNCRRARAPLVCAYENGLKIRPSKYSVGLQASPQVTSYSTGENIEAALNASSPLRPEPSTSPAERGNSSLQALLSPTASVLTTAAVFADNSQTPEATFGVHRSPHATGERRISTHSTGALLRITSCDSSEPIQTEAFPSNDVEASLFSFYIKHAGPWLDIVSPARCFGQLVPQLALSSPVLFYACLSASAHVMYLWGRTSQETHEYYHNKSISILIPLLDPSAADCTESLLLTSVILRMSEQYSEIADDGQYHLHGAFSLFANASASWSPTRIDAAGAAFWTYVRESIRICFLNEQACPFDLHVVDTRGLFDPSTDEVWTNRMTYLLAKACNTCWSTDAVSTPIAHAPNRDELEAVTLEVNRWERSLPRTFQPWYRSKTAARPFEDLRYLSSWHTIGWQQYYAAKTLLAAYSPVRTEQNVRALHQETRRTLIENAKMLCAVVFSDDEIGAGVNGTHLVAWCAQFFEGKLEQDETLRWLKNFMQDTSWPNKTCYEKLEKQWGR